MFNIKILKLLNVLESLHFQHFEMICTDESSTDDQKWMNNVNSEFWCHVDFNKKIVQTIRVLMTYRTHHLTLVLIHWPSGYKTRDQTSHSTLHSCPWRDIISRPCLWASQLWVYGYASQSSSSSAVGCCGAGRGGITSDILANAPPELAGASDESPPAGPLPEIPVKYPPWKIHQEGWKHWDWGFQTHLSCAWPIYWRGQTSGFHHSLLPQLKKKTT